MNSDWCLALSCRFRKALQDIIGEVMIVEEGPHVIAYTKLNNVGYNSGAQKRT